MKIALVHDWLTGMRGGERVFQNLCEIFPNADVFTLFHTPGSVSPSIEKLNIKTSFLQKIPYANKAYRYFLPLFPFAIEQFDLSDYDLIVSSSHCVAKGVQHSNRTCHIAYIHTPMRYAWELYDTYLSAQKNWLFRAGMKLCIPPLRRWDIESSKSVNYLIANSLHISDQIKKIYKKESQVVYPPVEVDKITPSNNHQGFYLMVTALVPYKRLDLAIQTFTELKKPLVIIGSGPDEALLKKMAGPPIKFKSWQPDEVVWKHYQDCRALIFPGLEDFGIVPVEAMAAGKAVIAYQAGGAIETVISLEDTTSSGRWPTGVLFPNQSISSLSNAIKVFEDNESSFNHNEIGKHAQRFSSSVFQVCIKKIIHQCYEDFKRDQKC